MAACRVCDAPSTTYLCRVDSDQLTKWIAELPSLMSQLQVSVTRQTRVDRVPVSYVRPPADYADEFRAIPARLRSIFGPFALPSTPWAIDFDASVLLDEVRNGVTTWVRHLCEQHGVQPPATSVLVGFLVRNVASIAVDEAAAEIWRDFERWTAKILKTIDSRVPDIYCGPCDVEDVRAGVENGVVTARPGKCGVDLYCVAGEQTLTCTACGMKYELAERKVKLLAQLDDRLATTGEIAVLLSHMMQPVTQAMVRKMAATGRLQQRGRATDAKSVLYSVGDVVAILRERAEKEAEREAREHQRRGA